jgi:hypothetical protein
MIGYMMQMMYVRPSTKVDNLILPPLPFEHTVPILKS